MADRYWVGGTAAWDDTAGTKWAATDGGAGGESVPTSADNVYFTATSGTVTVSISTTGANCANLDFTGFTGTLAGSTLLNIYGNMTLSATMTMSWSGALNIYGPCTFTPNGKSLNSYIYIYSGSAELYMAGALTTSWPITLYNGGLYTNGYTLTAAGIATTGGLSDIKTINISNSTVVLSGTSPISIESAATVSFTATNSSITASSTSNPILNGSTGIALYNFTFSGVNTNYTIAGSNSFNNLTINGRTTAGYIYVNLEGDQTLTGIFTVNTAPTNATARILVASNVIGTQRTISCVGVNLIDVDFRDIAIVGGPFGGTRLGDCKGNSGITFPAPKTVYCRLTGSGNWNNTAAWSATQGGTADITQFPLAQDTAVMPQSPTPYPGSGGLFVVNVAYALPTINMSARTSTAMTLQFSQNPFIYGNFTLGAAVTITGALNLTFSGRNTQTITSAGKTLTLQLTVDSPGGTVQLTDALNTSRTVAGALTLTRGTFNTNNFNVTLSGAAASFVSTSGYTRTLALGTGATFLVSGTGGWSVTSSGFTLTGTSSLSFSSASAKPFNGGGLQNYPTIIQSGAGRLSIFGSNKFANITNSYAATGATQVYFETSATNEFTAFSLSGTAGKLCTISETSITGSNTFLKKATPWYVGANSVDNGGNENLTFTAGDGIDYLAFSYVTGLTDVVILTASITEGMSSESNQGGPLISSQTQTEAMSVADESDRNLVYERSISEGLVSDDSSSSLRYIYAAIEEGVAQDDLQNSQRLFFVEATEPMTGEDVQSCIRAFFGQITEEMTSGSEQLAERKLFGVVVETMDCVDFPVAQGVFYAAATEPSSVLDYVTAISKVYASIVESSTSGESASAIGNFYGLVEENSYMVANNYTQGNFNISVVEGFEISDVVAGIGWFSINTTQNPDWVVIDDGQV